MAGFSRIVATMFLMLMLVFSIGNVAEARTCLSKSNRFKGPCARDSNCATVCESEGFSGGDCKGFRRRCFCTKHC